MKCTFSKEFSASSFTSVENAFIREYLTEAPGDAVKVYLYGLFLCQNQSQEESLADAAHALNLDEKKVVDYFVFWEEFGVVQVLSKEPLNVQYLPVRRISAGKPKKIRAEKYADFSKQLQLLLSARMISTPEYTEYYNIMETYSIKPEAMLMIVSYCIDRKGNDIGYRYIATVAKDFGVREINTVEKVEKELDSYLLRTGVIAKILKALKLKRQPDIDDQKLFKKWTQELCFEPDNIVFAASKCKKGTMEKLDSFLMELYSIKSFSKEEISAYVSKKEVIYDLTIRINQALSIFVEVLETEIDTYVRKWLSFGFEEDTLCFIASHLFKTGNNSLQHMDELIDELRGRGLVGLASVGDHFENERKTEAFIAKILATIGLSRRPTPWDKENLNVWRSWNFAEDMILEAAKKSAGRANPIAYMNGILSNWKANGVYTLEGAATESSSYVAAGTVTQEDYNREYEKRREVALLRAQKNTDKAMAIDGFAEIYSRLNRMGKDIAFASVTGNDEGLAKLEGEKARLTAEAERLLSSIGLSILDLSPRYRCVKCNDTGYIGTSRCDCFNEK